MRMLCVLQFRTKLEGVCMGMQVHGVIHGL